MQKLAQDIVERAYALDPVGLNTALRALALPDWSTLTKDLNYISWDTGGGCMMLVADLPARDGYRVGITGTEAEMPSSPDTFWLGIMDGDNEELYTLFVENGVVT